MKIIKTPLTENVISKLKAGDNVKISGIVYTARDAAHKKLFELLKEGNPLPFDIKNQIIYYVGPTPTPPGKVIGSAGPTTSTRMDLYTPTLLEAGLKGMIGKGKRSSQVIDAIIKFKAVYFGATGGAGALLSKCIKSSKIIAYEDLGPEAIRELIIEDFPCIVINDCFGNDYYQIGKQKWEVKLEIEKL